MSEDKGEETIKTTGVPTGDETTANVEQDVGRSNANPSGNNIQTDQTVSPGSATSGSKGTPNGDHLEKNVPGTPTGTLSAQLKEQLLRAALLSPNRADEAEDQHQGDGHGMPRDGNRGSNRRQVYHFGSSAEDQYAKHFQTGPGDRAARNQAREERQDQASRHFQASSKGNGTSKNTQRVQDGLSEANAAKKNNKFSGPRTIKLKREEVYQKKLIFQLEQLLNRMQNALAFIRDEAKEGGFINESELTRLRTAAEDDYAKAQYLFGEYNKTPGNYVQKMGVRDLIGKIKDATNAYIEELRTWTEDNRSNSNQEDAAGTKENSRAQSMDSAEYQYSEEDEDDCFFDEERELTQWFQQNTNFISRFLIKEAEVQQEPALSCVVANNLGSLRRSLEDSVKLRKDAENFARDVASARTKAVRSSILSYLKEVKVRNRDLTIAFQACLLSVHSNESRGAATDIKDRARRNYDYAWQSYDAVYETTNETESDDFDFGKNLFPDETTAKGNKPTGISEPSRGNGGLKGQTQVKQKYSEEADLKTSVLELKKMISSLSSQVNQKVEAMYKDNSKLQKKIQRCFNLEEDLLTSRNDIDFQPIDELRSRDLEPGDHNIGRRVRYLDRSEGCRPTTGFSDHATDDVPDQSFPKEFGGGVNTGYGRNQYQPKNFMPDLAAGSSKSALNRPFGRRSIARDPTSYQKNQSRQPEGRRSFNDDEFRIPRGFREEYFPDDPYEYPADGWYVENCPYPWNVAPRIKRGDLNKVLSQAKIEKFLGPGDNYFRWRNKVLGYVHKSPGTITSKMLAITALLDVENPILGKMIPNEQYSYKTYAALLWNLERNFGGSDRLLNYMLKEINERQVVEVNNAIELDEFCTQVQRFIEVQAELGEPTDGRMLFQTVFNRFPTTYHLKYGEWLGTRNAQHIMIGQPVQQKSLQNLLEWADLHLEVLRTEKEITDYAQSAPRPRSSEEPLTRQEAPRSSHVKKATTRIHTSDSDSNTEDDGHIAKAERRRTDEKHKTGANARRYASGESDEDQGEKQDRRYYWTRTPTKAEKVIDYDSSPDVEEYLVCRPTQKFECVLCRKQHPVRECNKFEELTPDERKKIAIQHRLCLNCLGAHFPKRCGSKNTCFEEGCKSKHHTLLHGAKHTIAASRCDRAERGDW